MDIITGAKDAILIGAGEIDCRMAEVIKSSISEYDLVIALDGGLKFCVEHGIKPDMIVGDFDSLMQDILLNNYPQEIIHRLPCEKDDTDTLAAIKMAINKGFERFTIYGGLGGRLSHTVANIQSLYYLKERGMHGELVGDNSRVFLIKDESITLQPMKAEEKTATAQFLGKKVNEVLRSQEGGYISIFSYSEKAQGVTLKNLKYEIENEELTNVFPIGVSNEFIGKTAEISVEKGALLIVLEF